MTDDKKKSMTPALSGKKDMSPALSGTPRWYAFVQVQYAINLKPVEFVEATEKHLTYSTLGSLRWIVEPLGAHSLPEDAFEDIRSFWEKRGREVFWCYPEHDRKVFQVGFVGCVAGDRVAGFVAITTRPERFIHERTF